MLTASARRFLENRYGGEDMSPEERERVKAQAKVLRATWRRSMDRDPVLEEGVPKISAADTLKALADS